MACALDFAILLARFLTSLRRSIDLAIFFARFLKSMMRPIYLAIILTGSIGLSIVKPLSMMHSISLRILKPLSVTCSISICILKWQTTFHDVLHRACHFLDRDPQVHVILKRSSYSLDRACEIHHTLNRSGHTFGRIHQIHNVLNRALRSQPLSMTHSISLCILKPQTTFHDTLNGSCHFSCQGSSKP